MESFELLRKYFARCGIANSQKSTKNHSFNIKNLTVLMLLCIDVSLIAIMLNEANTFDEITDIFFRCISGGTCGIIYVIIICNTSKLFKFIDSLEDTIHASE